ncbi:hypothetical protein [Lelliottia steviae]|uniref:hypothetical protein n=1 Tax=Pseudoalteromonas sp. TaxID=53249 RepID=UPI0018829DA1|nr:hypothetical protein [Lelliottia steviae]
MIVKVGKNGAIPLSEEVLSAGIKLHIGDILLCTFAEDRRSIQLEKYEDQTLSDEQIEEHGSLTRVVQLNPRDYE